MPGFTYKVTFEFPDDHPHVTSFRDYQLRELIATTLTLEVDKLAREMSSNGPGAQVAYRVDLSSQSPDATRATEVPAPLEPMKTYTPDRRTSDPGGELERPYQIDIDARHSVIHQPETKTRRAMCGNCGIRYEITDDPVENHHRAMQHKTVCGKGGAVYTEPQREQFLKEFSEQPMQRAFAERAAAALAAGADPEALRITGVSIFTPGPEAPQARAIAAAELGAQAAEAIRQMAPPRRWWQFWRWFE
jgi:hypothetical protein